MRIIHVWDLSVRDQEWIVGEVMAPILLNVLEEYMRADEFLLGQANDY